MGVKKYYSFIRGLHLYSGLLVSPLILVFSLSVLVLNHPAFFEKFKNKPKEETIHKQVTKFKLQNSDSLTAKLLIQQLGITGEIDWISKSDSTFSFPVNKPGLNQHIRLNTFTGEVLISKRKESFPNTTIYLHTMPGQHNAKMRGNSFFMKAWRIATDSMVYLILFVSVSGVFLWYFLWPERTLGIFSFSIGAAILIVFMLLLF